MEDELPIHFTCFICGYYGTDDELVVDDSETFYCPVCDSPDIEWEA